MTSELILLKPHTNYFSKLSLRQPNMFSSPKGKGKKKSTIAHQSAIRAVYDHNESQITWAKAQYDNLKSDMMTVMTRMRSNHLDNNAMNRILLQPTPAVKAHEVFREMISKEPGEEVTKQTTADCVSPCDRPKKGSQKYINLE
ncbi:hypothetical protein ACFE04_003653 [Oxalis oulophora]